MLLGCLVHPQTADSACRLCCTSAWPDSFKHYYGPWHVQLLIWPLQKSYVYFEVGTANKSTSMDKEDLASPFWSDTVTFDDVPADLAEESIKVQLWLTEHGGPQGSCLSMQHLHAAACVHRPFLSQASRHVLSVSSRHVLSGICTAPDNRSSMPCLPGESARSCLHKLLLAFPALQLSLCACSASQPLHNAWSSAVGLACMSLVSAGRCLRRLPPSLVNGAASRQCMLASSPACRPVNLTADATACCCRWRCTTTLRCCQTTLLEELRSATPAVTNTYNAWGATIGHHVHATASLAFTPGA